MFEKTTTIKNNDYKNVKKSKLIFNELEFCWDVTWMPSEKKFKSKILKCFSWTKLTYEFMTFSISCLFCCAAIRTSPPWVSEKLFLTCSSVSSVLPGVIFNPTMSVWPRAFHSIVPTHDGSWLWQWMLLSGGEFHPSYFLPSLVCYNNQSVKKRNSSLSTFFSPFLLQMFPYYQLILHS